MAVAEVVAVEYPEVEFLVAAVGVEVVAVASDSVEGVVLEVEAHREVRVEAEAEADNSFAHQAHSTADHIAEEACIADSLDSDIEDTWVVGEMNLDMVDSLNSQVEQIVVHYNLDHMDILEEDKHTKKKPRIT